MADPIFRLVRTVDLPPSFMSLGLPRDAFRVGAALQGTKALDTALNGPGDVLWLFKGSDYFTFDLRTKTVLRGPEPISQWASADAALPAQFQSGVDAALWGGELFPHVFHLFKGNAFIRLESQFVGAEAATLVREEPGAFERLLRVTETDTIGGIWCCDEAGCFLESAPSSVVHGVRDALGHAHFHQGAFHFEHNLRNGLLAREPISVVGQWQFSDPIDLAFYGAGPEEGHLFLVSDTMCARFDTRLRRVLAVEPLEQMFPRMAVLFARPQLFLVEDYTLEVHVGEIRRGGLVQSFVTPARSAREVVVVSEEVTKAVTALKQNVLESDDTATTDDFRERLEARQQAATESESYRHRLNALFEGEAQAKGLWGGEVKAELNVEGGTDTQREALARESLSAVESQRRDSTHKLRVSTMTQEQFQETTTTFFRSEKLTFDNLTGDTSLETQLFTALEPYVALLVLKDVRAAFTDGTAAPEPFPLPELVRRLPDLLGDPTIAERLVQYLASELMRIEDAGGLRTSIIDTAQPTSLRVDRDVRSTHTVETAPTERLSARGIIKGVEEFLQPTAGVTKQDIRA